jgi:hypothetical protein
MLKSIHSKYLAAGAFVGAAVMVAFPAAALATESGTAASGVKTVAANVGSEGVEIVLAILTALVGLIVAVIIIPKAVGLIKRFI